MGGVGGATVKEKNSAGGMKKKGAKVKPEPDREGEREHRPQNVLHSLRSPPHPFTGTRNSHAPKR